MDQKKILIIGANGQLGLALQAKYPNALAVDSDRLDITNLSALQNFNWNDVQLILNAAAFTNVDGAETLEGRAIAWKVNAEGPANLAKLASEKDITLVHISTDYVFDGTNMPHTEEESYSPLSVYGQSKAAGDIAVNITPKHYILRTSWVIGDGKNFVRTMLGLGQKGIAPTVVADQIGRPTFTSELVAAIDHLINKIPDFGIYNCSNDGDSISWSEFTRAIFAEAGFTLEVTDTTTEAYFAGKPGIAPRPLHSIFDLSKIMKTGHSPNDWRVDLKQYIDKELQR